MEQMMELMLAKMDSFQEKMEAKMDNGQEKMKTQVGSLASQISVNQEEMKAMLDASLKRMEANSGEQKSAAVREEIPKDEDTVKTSGAMKKRHRGRNLAAGRHGEPKDWTQGNSGSGKKLATCCRGMPRRAGVARRERKVFRKIRAQGNCGAQKELVATGRKMTRCAGVAQRKGNVIRKNRTRDNVEH
jgi:hypothetical protein